MDQVVNQLYTAGVLTSDQKAQIESLGTNQLKAAFLYEDVLMKGGSYRNVDVLRQVLQAVDKEGLAMLLPKRGEGNLCISMVGPHSVECSFSQ